MSRFWPTPAETASLRFVLELPGMPLRYFAAGGLFVVGLAIWLWSSSCLAGLGLAVVLLGHLPLWVRTQTTAPGGATPLHEEIWAPVDPAWTLRLEELEGQGETWDTSPWDITNLRGVAIFLLVGLATTLAIVVLASPLGGDMVTRLLFAAAALLVPVWLNGIRTTWNPSELRLKGQALDGVAFGRHGDELEGEYEIVPLLALREGKHGKYPVDARVMLRPSADDGSGFLGIQVQVAINSVQGTDYPYLYCVVLGKSGFQHRESRREGSIVFENGAGDDVDYMVVRQHADKKGGWHTDPRAVARLVKAALEEARAARERNRPGGGE